MRGLNPVRLGNEVERWYLSTRGLNPVRLGKLKRELMRAKDNIREKTFWIGFSSPVLNFS